MKPRSNKLLRRCYTGLLTGLCVAMGALLIAAAVGLAREGAARDAADRAVDWVFTREKVAQRLTPMLVLAPITLALTIAGRCLGIGPTDRLARVHGADAPFSETARTRWLRLTLIGCAVLMIVAGIFNGGLRDVLIKAVNICSECVGLG